MDKDKPEDVQVEETETEETKEEQKVGTNLGDLLRKAGLIQEE